MKVLCCCYWGVMRVLCCCYWGGLALCALHLRALERQANGAQALLATVSEQRRALQSQNEALRQEADKALLLAIGAAQ